MKLSPFALPLLTACTASDGPTLRKTIYVEVPVESEASPTEGESGPGVDEQPDLGEDPGYPGEDTGEVIEDSGLVDEIPYEDEVDIVEVSNETCESLMSRYSGLISNYMALKSGDDSLSVWTEDSGLTVEMGMDFQVNDGDHVFVCAYHHRAGSVIDQYGSVASYYEVNPETGATYVDPKLWVTFPDMPAPLPEYYDIFQVWFGVINYESGEMAWVRDSYASEPDTLDCWYGADLPFGITFCDGRP